MGGICPRSHPDIAHMTYYLGPLNLNSHNIPLGVRFGITLIFHVKSSLATLQIWTPPYRPECPEVENPCYCGSHPGVITDEHIYLCVTQSI